jgi:phage shock protein E
MFNLIQKIFGSNDIAIKAAIKEDAFLVDVRTPAEYAQGNVKGSVNIPLDRIAQQTDKFKNKKHIIVFCKSGGRSGQAKSILESNGFQNVINGGSWQNVNELTKE